MAGTGMNDGSISNPFATKFVKAGRLSFVGLGEGELDRLAKMLVQQNGNGQIVGPHGVGKTTLTFELEKRTVRLCGTQLAFKFVHKTIGPRGTVRSAETVQYAMNSDGFENDGDSKSAPRQTKTILVLDGVERLSWFQRLALIKSCQRKRFGLLLTSHGRIWGVPALVELEPELTRFESVVKTLTSGIEFNLSTEQLREIFTDNDSNMREALMSCYDEFEASRARTAC